jgi:hypothetical protein
MVRRLAVLVGFTLALLVAREASAAPIFIPSFNLDLWAPGLIQDSEDREFFDQNDPDDEKGNLDNDVFLKAGGLWTYMHTVRPDFGASEDARYFKTTFSVFGLPSDPDDIIAGYRFSQSADYGDGDEFDFLITLDDAGRLQWTVSGADLGFSPGDVVDLSAVSPEFPWDADVPFPNGNITFFFVSTAPPFLLEDAYKLRGTEDTTALGESFATTPEPGSMVLLGSGVAALYGAARRRRNMKAKGNCQIIDNLEGI